MPATTRRGRAVARRPLEDWCRKSYAPFRIWIFLGLCAGLFLFSTEASAQNPDDPKDLLLQVGQHVVDTVKRLPKYVCVQTIDRMRYEPVNAPYEPVLKHQPVSCDDIVARVHGKGWKRRLSSSDRIRLEVAVKRAIPGIEDEMYSWPGEHRFSDQSLFELIREGAVSTGSFSSILAGIFGGNVARFSYNGDHAVAGRTLATFGFDVAQENSRFLYLYGNAPQREAALPYNGTIFVDPDTSDPVRLTVRSDELPEETGACELAQNLEYGRVHLNGADFLLPTTALISVIHTDGTEAENRIHYSSCREFSGETEILFGSYKEDLEFTPPETATAPPPALPPGLALKVVFNQPINSATAAAGDLLRGSLKADIRDRSLKLIAPEGSAVTGRIIRIRRVYSRTPPAENRRARGREPSLIIDVRLETLDIEGIPRPLNVAFDSGLRRSLNQTGPFTIRVDVGSLERSLDRVPDSDVAVFEFWDESPNFVVKGRMESNWVTVAR